MVSLRYSSCSCSSDFVIVLSACNFTVGRTKKLRADVMEKFIVYATAQGFPEDSILTPPAAGKPLKSPTPAGLT